MGGYVEISGSILEPYAYTGDADMYCPRCADLLYGPDVEGRCDGEGNEVHPVFGDEEWDYLPSCGRCRVLFVGARLTRHGVAYVADWLGERFGEIAPDLRAALFDHYGEWILHEWWLEGFADEVATREGWGDGAALFRLDDGSLWALEWTGTGFDSATQLESQEEWEAIARELEGDDAGDADHG